MVIALQLASWMLEVSERSLIGITKGHHFARYKTAEDATRKSLMNDFEANFEGPNNILKQSPSHAADIDNFKQPLKHASKQKKPIGKNFTDQSNKPRPDPTRIDRIFLSPSVFQSSCSLVSQPELLSSSFSSSSWSNRKEVHQRRRRQEQSRLSGVIGKRTGPETNPAD
ncbi:hypothetical protein ACFE04_017135 [Oxalis oulophora]